MGNLFRKRQGALDVQVSLLVFFLCLLDYRDHAAAHRRIGKHPVSLRVAVPPSQVPHLPHQVVFGGVAGCSMQ